MGCSMFHVSRSTLAQLETWNLERGTSRR